MDDSDLFLDILGAQDRDRCPGARAVLSYSDDDDPAFLSEIERAAQARIELRRRGAHLGHLAVLGVEGRAAREVLARRWADCRPIVLPGAVGNGLAPGSAEEQLVLATHRRLARRGGLPDWLNDLRTEIEPPFSIAATPRPIEDSERDIDCIGLGWGGEVDDLWIKSSRLSSHPDDRSIRLRISFGREGGDDANPDRMRLRLVHELAGRLIPACGAVHAHEGLRDQLEDLAGSPLLYTQHIAYWNCPGGAPSSTTTPSTSRPRTASSEFCTYSWRAARSGSPCRSRISRNACASSRRTSTAAIFPGSKKPSSRSA